MSRSSATDGRQRAACERAKERIEQPLLIEDPVEHGVGEDRVEALGQLELAQVGLQHGRSVAERAAGVLDHLSRRVDRDNTPARQPLQQPPVTRPVPQPASRCELSS